MLQHYPKSGGAIEQEANPTMISMKIGPFPFWVISPFAEAQLWKAERYASDPEYRASVVSRRP
jgi:hypothetical protein